MKNKLVLVTGGTGFIGSHLIDALVQKGFRVRVLDNAPTIPNWCNKQAEYIRGTVKSKRDWLKSLIGVDYVFHLSAYMDYHLDFSTYIDTNVRSCALLYEVIQEQKLPVKKIVVASSQSVYGEGKYTCRKHGTFYAQPRTETQLKKHQWEVVCPHDNQVATPIAQVETDQLHPQTPYAITKYGGEQLCLNLGMIYQIPTVALRYSIVQGPRQTLHHFYSGALRDFSIRARNNLPIIMQEDAGQMRDFVSIHDVIAAHLVVLQNKKADYEVFNVGSGKTTKVRELAILVAKTLGVPFKSKMQGEFKINSPRHSIMNNDKLKRLGWRPKRTLHQSVIEYIAWAQTQPNALSMWNKTYAAMHKEQTLKL